MSKNKFKSKLRLLSFCLIFLISLSFSSKVNAQETKGITVLPSTTDVNLDTDQPEIELNYTNTTDTTITLDFKALDFTDLEDSGKIRFLEGNDASNYKYSLSSWITFERESMTLGSNENQTLKISIAKDKLSPGAHYASIQATISPQKPEGGKVNVSGIISSLVFVTTSTGNEIEEASAAQLTADRNSLDFPKKFVLRFNNKGNVALVPHGLLKITNSFGQEVSRGILNEGSLKTLPETIRRYEIGTKTYSSFLLPGFYKAEIVTKYGKNDKESKIDVRFFSTGSFNTPSIAIATLLVITATFLFIKRKKTKTNSKSV